jgi:hypothetical protein
MISVGGWKIGLTVRVCVVDDTRRARRVRTREGYQIRRSWCLCSRTCYSHLDTTRVYLYSRVRVRRVQGNADILMSIHRQLVCNTWTYSSCRTMYCPAGKVDGIVKVYTELVAYSPVVAAQVPSAALPDCATLNHTALNTVVSLEHICYACPLSRLTMCQETRT